MAILSVVGLMMFDTVLRSMKTGESEIYVFYKPYALLFTGCFLFFLEKDIFEKIAIGCSKNLNLRYVDRISFDVYLIHGALLFSPVNVMSVFANPGMNIALMLVITVILSAATAFVSDRIKKSLIRL